MFMHRSITPICAAAITFLAVGQSARAAPILYFADTDGDLRSSDFDGTGVAMLSGGLGFIEVDHQFISFTDPANDHIGRVDLDGSNFTVLADAASHGIDSPYGLARFGKTGLMEVNGGNIEHLDLTSLTLTTRVDNLSDPRGIPLAGDTVIIADAGELITNKYPMP